jgi:fatty-acyl-CoA synthase
VTDLLHSPPTVGTQALQALGRYPSRTAFSWSGGSISYRGAIERITRMQRVLMNAGASPAARMAFLSANRADAGALASRRRFPDWRPPGCIRWLRWTIRSIRSKIAKPRSW